MIGSQWGPRDEARSAMVGADAAKHIGPIDEPVSAAFRVVPMR